MNTSDAEIAAAGLHAAVYHPSINTTTRNSMVRAFLRSCSDEVKAAWVRLKDAERQREHRSAQTDSTETPDRKIVTFRSPLQNVTRQPVSRSAQSNGTGQASPSSPAPSPGPPSPPTPPPFIPPNPPPVVPENESLAASAPTDEPDAPPAAAGGGGKELTEAEKAARKAEGDAKRAVMDRLGKPFRRRSTTEWSEKEKKKLGELYRHPDFLSSLDEVEAFYALPPSVFGRKPRSNEWADYRRHDLITQLNSWWGEVGKARKFFEENPQHRATIKRPNGNPHLSAEFLAWMAKEYPSVTGKRFLSDIIKEVRGEFRAAHPKTSITAPSP